VELNYSGLNKAYFTQITHRIVAKDHQHTRETKEEPYQAPKAHTLRTGTFAKPYFITLVVSRSKTIQATSKNKQMERAFSFGNSVWEFWTTFQEIPFPVEISVREEENSLSIYIPSEISGFFG